MYATVGLVMTETPTHALERMLIEAGAKFEDMQLKKITLEDQIKQRKKKIIELTERISKLMRENQKDKEELKKI